MHELVVGLSASLPDRTLLRNNLASVLCSYGLPSFSEEVLDQLNALNTSDALKHLDFELNSIRAVYARESQLQSVGYDTGLLKSALLFSDIGKTLHPTVARVYLAGEVRYAALHLPLNLALATIGVNLSELDREQMRGLGFDPDAVTLKEFYTRAHLEIGRDWLYTLFTDQPDLVKVAVSHHFTQGFNELGITACSDIDATSIPLLRHVAAAEWLDKVEAGITRRQKTLQEAHAYAACSIESGIVTHYGKNAPVLLKAYQEVNADLINLGVFEVL